MLIMGGLFASNAHAEPGVSFSHIPYLWALGAVISLLLSWLVLSVLSFAGKLKSSKKKWLLGVLLFVLFLLSIGPLVVVFGSIIVTGRTM